MQALTDLEYLALYRVKVKENGALKNAMENLEARMGPKGLAARGPNRVTNEPQFALHQHLDACRERYEENSRCLESMTPRFERILRHASNSRDRAILTDYYGRGIKDDVIACRTALTSRHIRRIRKQFTQKLEECA